MSRYQDWIEAEAAAAEYDEWKRRRDRDAGVVETTSARIRENISTSEGDMSEFQTVDSGKQLAKFSPTDSAIAKLASEYLPLKIKDVNDDKGYAIVHQARMDIRNKRVSVEKVRKELKSDALEYGRKVDAEAKRLTALLSPIEEHLESEEGAYNRAKEEIRNAARLKAEAEEQAKRDAEAAKIKAEQEAEAARIKAEQDAENERLRLEREKLAAERRAQEAELAEQRRLIAEQQAKAEAERAAKEKVERERQEAIEAKQREAQAKIDSEIAAIEAERRAAKERLDAERRVIEAEAKRLADLEAAHVRAAEMEKAKAEAAERAKRETEARLAREAAEAKAKAEQEEAERKREEALRPDREKLFAVADAMASFVVPEVSEDARKARAKVMGVLSRAAQSIRKIAGDITNDEDE